VAKKLDPRLLEILKQYGENAEEALWDCHGTWVAYHKAIERIAAKAGVVFDMPQIIEANTAAKTVSIVVAGTMGSKREWSFGEASPANCKNSYVYAMAEKRAKDRVVIKLVGLSGIYSEEEADDFKPGKAAPGSWEPDPNDPMFHDVPSASGTPIKSSAQLKRDNFWPDFERELYECKTLHMLEKFKAAWRKKAMDDGWNAAFKAAAKDRIEGHEKAILDAMDADELANVPLDKALKHSIQNHPLMAGE
jgi:hypothetical protein